MHKLGMEKPNKLKIAGAGAETLETQRETKKGNKRRKMNENDAS